jgi:hypothetical protein
VAAFLRRPGRAAFRRRRLVALPWAAILGTAGFGAKPVIVHNGRVVR